MNDAAGGDSFSPQYTVKPPPGKRGAGVVISWTLILASVLLIFTFNLVSSLEPAAPSGGSVNANVQLEVAGRYTVGATLSMPEGRDPSMNKAVFLKQIDATVHTTPDRVRAAILAGEIGGADDALTRIKSLQGQLTDAPLRKDAAALRTIYTSGPSKLTKAQRADLIDRYGWFGHLALGYKQSADDPDRSVAIHGAVRAFVAMFTMVCVVLLAIGAGLVLLIIALIFYADGKIRRAYVPATTDTGPFLEAFAVYMLGSIVLGLLVGRFGGHHLRLDFTYLLLACLPVGLALLWPLWRGVTPADWRRGVGWHSGTGVIREMFWGITVYITGLPLIALGVLVTAVLAKLSGAQVTHPIETQTAGGGAALSLYVLAAVFAPIAEESLFRGALFHHLRSRHGWWMSAIVVSLIFASLHPQGWAAIPALGMIAMTLAAIREFRGTIIASATAHALNNAVVVTVLVFATR